jgi:hypothetical protein
MICKWGNVASNVRLADRVIPRSETCLCQNGYDCKICRLQKQLKDARTENANFLDATGRLLEKVEEYEQKHDEENGMEGAGDDDIERDDAEGDKTKGDYAEEGVEHEGEDEGEGLTALQYAIHRAQTAELENGNLLVVIARLKRENKVLRNKLSTQQIASSSPMTLMASSTSPNPSVDHAEDDSYGDSGHPKHGRGGKTRPGGGTNSGAQSRRRTAGAIGGNMSGKVGHANTTKVPEKTAKKRQRDTHDESEDNEEDSEEEPPFKRYRSTAPPLGRTVEGRKGSRKPGANTCGFDNLAKKKHQEIFDESDDESFNPGPPGRQSRFSGNAGRDSIAPKANQPIAKTGRRTNNSQAGFLDTFGLDSLTSSSRNTLDVFSSGSVTSNSTYMGDESGAATAETPQGTFSTATTAATTLNATTLANSTQIATTLTTPTVANPTQTATTLASPTPANTARTPAASRRAQGWSHAELQVLIGLVGAHRNAPIGPNGKRPDILHDVRLFELMSRQLAAQGIHRSTGACKNEWNRRGRQLSGIDNRKIANPSQMATSLQ